MTIDTEDFEKFEINLSEDEKTLTLTVKAFPNGKDIIIDRKKRIYKPNPNFKKWRAHQISKHLKHLGYKIKLCIACSNKNVTNGCDDKLESVMVFELYEKQQRVKKNEKSKPTRAKPPTPSPKTRSKRNKKATTK